MELLEFTLPPLPHFIASGFTKFTIGEKHMSRRNIGVFDMLAVMKGCLYIGEGDRRYEVSEGTALLLRPDAYHYATEGCREKTDYYWLHFQTAGSWRATDTVPPRRTPELRDERDESYKFDTSSFPLVLPQFARLPQPGKFGELMEQIIALAPEAHLNASRFKQQVLFQEALRQLTASIESQLASPAAACAEQAAAYLRNHYREEITARSLGEALSFHPVYVARCMQKEYGLSPMAYLLRYRIEQSKLLLMQTDFPIARIAEEVGFNQAPYFSSCFLKTEGLSPREYRQRFS
ncbi:AraC family transcriptional regulator [Cohnella sp. LGH]|uniref:AraC-like protein n=1 Tax=Cohnella phaseoli TaxID=456490 RepID=A0A3D9I4F6_9BACL|nr:MULTISPECIES: AraC family transcriptional regulator [Cohnella]QTH42486.1 AraC family transcriptional regulator [Cohnella sp. LGH]RED56637.1 AraC-like protein [Cohnella phaseoli]